MTTREIREFDSALSTLRAQMRGEDDPELSLLKANFDAPKDTRMASQEEILEKACCEVKAGRPGLIDAGNIERRVNRWMPLLKAHQAALGLSGVCIKTLRDENPASRFSHRTVPQRKVVQQSGIPIGRTELPVSSHSNPRTKKMLEELFTVAPPPLMPKKFRSIQRPRSPADRAMAVMNRSRATTYDFTTLVVKGMVV